MACSVNVAYAPNGNESILFKELVKRFKDENRALELYLSTKTAKFKAGFGDWQSDEFDKSKLDANGEPLFSDVVRNEYITDQEILDKSKEETKAYVEASTNMVNFFEKARDVLIRRIAELDRGTTKGGTEVKNKLNKLKKDLKVLDWRTGVIKFTATSMENIKYASNRLNAELSKPEPNPKTLHRFYNMLTAFDVLDSMRAEIRSNNTMMSSMEEEVQKLDVLIGMKDGAKTKYKKYLKNRVASALAKESSKETQESIMRMLDRGEKDVSASERWLQFAGDSTDTVIALVAKVVNTQQQRTRHTSIEFTEVLSSKLEAMEKERPDDKGNAEKLYGPMLERDSNGKLTGYIVHEKHSKPQYEAFKAKYEGTSTFEFYKYFVEEYDRLNANLPLSVQMGHKLPSLMKSTIDAVLSSDNKLKKFWDVEKQKWVATNTDTELGQTTDDSQRVIDTIPIHFTQSYDSAVYNAELQRLLKADVGIDEAKKQATEYAIAKLPESISYDLATSLQAFQYMSENYANMSEVLDVVEGAREFLFDRDLEVVNTKRVPFISKITDSFGSTITDNKVLIKGAESNAYKMLDTYLKMQVFGQTEQDLGNFSIGNMQLDTRKLIKNLMSYNSHVMIGFNVLAASSNIAMGETMQWVDAFGGEYYKPKDYLKAKKEYYTSLAQIAGDVMERTPKSKVNLINEFYDFLGDYHPEGVGASESSNTRRAIKNGSLFFLNSAGEHKMQSQAAMAILMATETFDVEGKVTGNLWTAHEAKDGKLTTKPDTYIKVKGVLVKYEAKQKEAMSRKIQTVLRRMHGNYNKQTAATWQRNAILGLVGQFRKWITTGFNRRWERSDYNEFAEQDLEGSYRSFGKFIAGLLNDVAKLQIKTGVEWGNMTDHQKANVKRTTAELCYFVATAISLAVLKSLAGGLDDEKDKNKLAALRYSMYLANRLQTELLFYVNPADTWQILKTPAATMSSLERVSKTLNYALPWNWNEKYEMGIHKGESKLGVSVSKNVPVWNQITKLTPSGLKGQIEYFNIN